MRADAQELVGRSPSALVAVGTQALLAPSQLTRTVPIVFVGVADPVGAGFVASLARPGGNVTGFSSTEYGFTEKWVELLKEIAPGLVRAGIIFSPENPQSIARLRAAEAVAPALNIRAIPIPVHNAPDLEAGREAHALGPRCAPAPHARLPSGARCAHHFIVARLMGDAADAPGRGICSVDGSVAGACAGGGPNRASGRHPSL